MKLAITATACGVALLSGLALAQNADAPVVVLEVEGKSSNELALLAMEQMKEYFTVVSAVKDEESAKALTPKMEAAAKKLAALEAPLKKAVKPTDEELKKFAVHMVAFEGEMKAIAGVMRQNMKDGGDKLMNTLNPLLAKFEQETKGTLEILITNYPEEKLRVHKQDLKKEKAEKEGVTKKEEAPTEKVEAPKEGAPEAPKKAE